MSGQEDPLTLYPPLLQDVPQPRAGGLQQHGGGRGWGGGAGSSNAIRGEIHSDLLPAFEPMSLRAGQHLFS